MTRIAILASGTGSNARKIVEYFRHHPTIEVSLVASNKKTAPVLEMATAHNIPTHYISRAEFYETEDILKIFNEYLIDFVVLAGFLWLIPPYLIKAYPQCIVNIHPALLPNYGGKGMYGMHVHRAVKAAGETQSGMTIHYVNEKYDSGAILFQAKVALSERDTAEDVQQKVLELEHRYYAKVIETLLSEKK